MTLFADSRVKIVKDTDAMNGQLEQQARQGQVLTHLRKLVGQTQEVRFISDIF